VLSLEGDSTSSIPYDASTAMVRSALEALPDVGAGNVVVSGGSENIVITSGPVPYVVTFVGALAGNDVAPMTATSALTGSGASVGIASQPPEARSLVVATTQRAGGAPRFSDTAPECPNASKIGTVEVTTPLLNHPLPGSVYLAAQEDNPFLSLLAIYIVVDDPQSGAIVKLAGHVEPDPVTGRLTTTFDNNPQLPFEDLKLDLFGGPRAPLVTPAACETAITTSELEPWSHKPAAGEEAGTPDAIASSSFAINQGCGAAGFSPLFTAGTTNNQAGAYSPFVMSFSRKDSEQDFRGLEETLPPGLLAKLAGVRLCGGAEADTGSCPGESQIGTVTVAAGVGLDPVYVPGTVYLTGPYNGGPFGEVVEVPAIARPFDLDEDGRPVVVRGSIRVNPSTAQATVLSDPFPTILRGIPLRVRSVSVTLDRPGFVFNPTNCSPLAVTGTLTSTAGANARVSSPFEAANCASLPFKPSFTVSTQAKTSKADGASLTVKIAQRPGEANIQKVDLQLLLVLPARLTTLQKACTEAQFTANPAGCPEASDIGMATAVTPVLNAPLTGPAYLVSHGSAAFPDVEFVLQGKDGVQIVLDGKTNIKKGITYSKFETVPDAPIGSFETVLPESPHSALAGNGSLCAPTKTVTMTERVTRRVHGHVKRVSVKVKKSVAEPLQIPTTITAQNGAVLTPNTKIGVTGCPKAKTPAKKKKVRKTTKAKKK
jgi:hypothetical protein